MTTPKTEEQLAECVIAWLKLGKVPGLKLQREGRRLVLYPQAET